MGLRILHTADWHLDSPFASLSAPLRDRMRREQLRLPGLLAEYCRRECCDLALLAGDIFDGRPRRETLDLLKQALADCQIPVLISPGNHDHCGPGSCWVEEQWPENVFIFTQGMEAIEIADLHCRIFGAGYQSMDCPPLLEGFKAAQYEGYQIGLLHGDPGSASSPCCPITTAQVRASGLDYLALGHIHQSGAFQAGKTLCAWPGCPMGRGWDETGVKGFYLITLEENARIRPIILDFPRFLDLTVDCTDGTLAALERVLPPVAGKDLYRITLTGPLDEDLSALRWKYGHLNLELLDRRTSPIDPWENAEEDTLRGVYLRLLQEAAQNADAEEARIIRLAAEISQQLLDGKEVQLL